MGRTSLKGSRFSWKEAFLASPGPRSLKSAALLYLKGVCMGAADIIPGVSGGTIALITGIYEKLLQAIKSADMEMARKALTLDIKGALARIHFRFLLCATREYSRVFPRYYSDPQPQHFYFRFQHPNVPTVE